MNREDIIRMARNEYGIYAFTAESLAEFATIIAAAECEAVIAIVNDNSDSDGLCCTDDLLAAIRVRGMRHE